MPTFYFDEDVKEQFLAPQFTRLRHRYRGVRESWKIDLELKQMHFSVHALYNRYDALRTTYLASMDVLLDGGAITGVNDNTNTPIVLDGLNDLIARVAELQARVKRLET